MLFYLYWFISYYRKVETPVTLGLNIQRGGKGPKKKKAKDCYLLKLITPDTNLPLSAVDIIKTSRREV